MLRSGAADPSRTQLYTYDPLNRVLTAKTQGTLNASGQIDCSIMVPGSSSQTKYWGESFTYDSWANLTGKNTTLCNAETTPLGATYRNQLSGYGYDAAGNMLGFGSSVSYAYDAESELASAGSYSYVYDGDGNRVAKISGSTGTLYWYGGPGIVLETDLHGIPQSEYVFFGGQRIGRRDLSGTKPVYLYFANQIHSTALITDVNGNVQDDADYYPWGGTLQFSSGVANHYWFTGKERDSESGLDYFGARYYGNTFGRFLTADWSARVEGVPYADFNDPQSLNLYGYVRDNPITRVDPDGHCTDPFSCTIEGGAIGSEAGPFGTVIGAGIGLGIGLGAAPLIAKGVEKAVHALENASHALEKVGAPNVGNLDGLPVHPQQLQNQNTSAGTNTQGNASTQGQSTPGSPSTGNLPKPPKGRGSAPTNQRDKKRVWTKTERQEKLKQQNGKCAQCGQDKTVDETNGHHAQKRWADGGRTDDANHAEVCIDCHKDLHQK